ncbi:transmembrane protein 176 isoform X2 [Centropristis striata]|uniref:transmembrane protein 176 isoform X2 n=1 Tax=Centropristis striata TaxID=184440 RepID=UPI0027DFC940|nr:transmembrane protein 176 isoform X2 [Centropristis striata]
MAVAVTRDLTLQVQEDVNAVKLTDRQQALRAAIQKGEPKCLGFITAGTVAIILDKHSTIKILQVCLIASIVSAVLSVVALIIYSIDIDKHPGVPCSKTVHGNCFHKYYATHLSRGLKSSLLVFTLAQAVISAVVCFLLFRQRRSFGQYASLMEAPSPALIPPELN